MTRITSFYGGETGARAWAQLTLAQPGLVIVDTESTGLDSHAEVVSFAAVGRGGLTLYNFTVKPVYPVPEDAIRIHGIRNADLVDAKPFDEVYPTIRRLFDQQHVVIYNAEADMRFINQSAAPYGLPPLDLPDYRCAMKAYAAYYGDYSEYHDDFRYQKLVNAAGRMGHTYRAHNALEDCLATLAVLEGMAAGK